MPAPEVLSGIRVVADPAVIDAVRYPAGSRVLRLAPDDVLVLDVTQFLIDDPDAIVEPEWGFVGYWVDRSAAEEWLAGHADWHLRSGDGLSQGMVAALPVKILTEGERALVIVPTSFAGELEERLTSSTGVTLDSRKAP